MNYHTFQTGSHAGYLYFLVIYVAEHDTVKHENVTVLRCIGWLRQVSLQLHSLNCNVADSLSRIITSVNYLSCLQSNLIPFSECLQ